MAQANWQSSKVEYWKHLPAPARPWPSEVVWFEKYVVEKKGQKKMDVLILGATVEFRSMCHSHGVNVHVVDFSRKFYDILSEQPMQHRGPEIFYEQDWRSMDLGKKFDLILGDLVANVLHTSDYKVFFEHILSHLEPDGLFVNRYWAKPDRTPIDLAKVARTHYELYGDRYSFYQTSMQYVYPYKADPPDFIWNIAASQAGIDQIHRQGLLKDEDYNFFTRALAVEKNPASTLFKEDFEKIINHYFQTNAVHYGLDPGHDWFPIYVLSPKN